MPLELLPMEEQDLDVYLNICWVSFKDDLMGLMYPNGYTEAAREWTKKHYVQDWRDDPDKIRFMKVVDSDLPDDHPDNKIIGVAMWKFQLKARSEEQLEAEKKVRKERGPAPDSNEALLEEFFSVVGKYKREILGGRAHVLLQLLATHPDHHRRGIGAMHLRWGSEHADGLGLPCYLEASPMGKPLYLREGYEVICDLPFDSKQWGHPKDLPHYCMLRPAKEMNGQAS